MAPALFLICGFAFIMALKNYYLANDIKIIRNQRDDSMLSEQTWKQKHHGLHNELIGVRSNFERQDSDRRNQIELLRDDLVKQAKKSDDLKADYDIFREQSTEAFDLVSAEYKRFKQEKEVCLKEQEHQITLMESYKEAIAVMARGLVERSKTLLRALENEHPSFIHEGANGEPEMCVTPEAIVLSTDDANCLQPGTIVGKNDQGRWVPLQGNSEGI